MKDPRTQGRNIEQFILFLLIFFKSHLGTSFITLIVVSTVLAVRSDAPQTAL